MAWPTIPRIDFEALTDSEDAERNIEKLKHNYGGLVASYASRPLKGLGE